MRRSFVEVEVSRAGFVEEAQVIVRVYMPVESLVVFGASNDALPADTFEAHPDVHERFPGFGVVAV